MFSVFFLIVSLTARSVGLILYIILYAAAPSTCSRDLGLYYIVVYTRAPSKYNPRGCQLLIFTSTSKHVFRQPRWCVYHLLVCFRSFIFIVSVDENIEFTWTYYMWLYINNYFIAMNYYCYHYYLHIVGFAVVSFILLEKGKKKKQ